MATTSAVLLHSPGGEPDTGIYVHYDGDDVADQLRSIIDRHGYRAAFDTFAAQPSRFWRHLDTGTSAELPEFVARIPENIPISRAVPGYGVLFAGPDLLDASARVTVIDPARDRDRGYAVSSDGTVRIVR